MTARMKKRGQAFSLFTALIKKVDDAWREWVDYHINIDPDPHPQYVLPTELPQVLVSWLTSTAYVGPDPGFFNYVTVEPTTPEVNLGPFPVTGPNQFITQWTREVEWTTDIDFYQLTTNLLVDVDVNGPSDAQVELYAEGYQVNSAGVETLIQTSGTTTIVEGKRAQAVMPITWNELMITPGDRIRVKLYASEISSNPTLNVYVDGQNLSRLLTIVPIASAPAPHADTHKAPELGAEFGSDPLPFITLPEVDDNSWAGKESIVNGSPVGWFLRKKAGEDRLEFYDLTSFIVNELGAVGYGSLGMTGIQAGADIPGIGYVDLDEADLVRVAGRGMTILPGVDPGRFSFQAEGLWRLDTLLNFNHIEAQNGRQTQLQLYDYTDNVPTSLEVVIFIARNQPGTTITIPVFFTVSAAAIDHEFGWRMGNIDDVAGVVWESQITNFQYLDTFSGLIP